MVKGEGGSEGKGRRLQTIKFADTSVSGRRAARGKNMIHNHYRHTSCIDSLGDVLADLLHHARVAGVDFDKEMAWARKAFAEDLAQDRWWVVLAEEGILVLASHTPPTGVQAGFWVYEVLAGNRDEAVFLAKARRHRGESSDVEGALR